MSIKVIINFNILRKQSGDVAQMVERSLSMREVRGSIPRISNLLFRRMVSLEVFAMLGPGC
jgi:hypothetical protein